jgi:hypothetical protein
LTRHGNDELTPEYLDCEDFLWLDGIAVDAVSRLAVLWFFALFTDAVFESVDSHDEDTEAIDAEW